MVYACHPSYVRSINRRTAVQISLIINTRSYLKKITKAKKEEQI
jgi:hypothetical protein